MTNDTGAEDADRKAKVLEEKRNVTSKISDSCRVVGFGLLAIFYTLKIGSADMVKISTDHPYLVWAVGVFGFLAIFFDYLQYFFGSLTVDAALQAPNHKYDHASFAYKARGAFFHIKQYSVILGVIALGLLFSKL